jgi:hypothetical protein
MDEILREALVLGDPDAPFGPCAALMDYREGQLVAPTVEAPPATQ